MSEFPYTLDTPCPVCQSPIVVKRKRKKVPKYCSVECYNSTIQKEVKIITNRKCLQCGKSFRHHKKKYCSRDCSNKHRAKPKEIKLRTCLCCGKEYQLWAGNFYSKYCSNDCFTKQKINKYSIDLGNLDDTRLLGQIWATAIVKDLLEIRFYGSNKTLEDLSKNLNSQYPIKSTRSEVWDNFFKTTHRVIIYNRDLICKLLDLGLEEPLRREWPLIDSIDDKDFIESYIESVNKINKGGTLWVWMISKNMAYETSNKFGGSPLYTEGNWWWLR